MVSYQVICVTKKSTDGYSSGDCRVIDEIGYIFGNTLRRYRKSTIHDSIERGNRYYVKNGSTETDLIADERNGTKYVRTEPNYTDSDNLLELSSCDTGQSF